MLRLIADLWSSPLKFKPTEIAHSFGDLLILAKMKKPHLIIFDKDDTLTYLHQFQVHNSTIKHTIGQLKTLNIQMYILSNSIKEGDPVEVEGIPILRTTNKKPYNESQVRKVIDRTPYFKVWMVGDRLMTDIYLANKIGIQSVLVPPIQESTIEQHGLFVYLLRKVERQYISFRNWK